MVVAKEISSDIHADVCFLGTGVYVTIISVKYPYMWRLKAWKMLTLLISLCCVDFENPIGVKYGVRRQNSSAYWTQLSR
jgi:hypothetical protein